MIYLFTFIICLIAGQTKYATINGEKVKFVYITCVLWIYIFLCFGYMTGSDWRGYELMYLYNDNIEHYKREPGFYYLVRILQNVITDFWVFSAVLKIVYLYSIVYFFKHLTKDVYIAIGLSLTYGLLFMIIDCPMRFMIAQTVLLFSSYFLFKNQWLKFAICGFISVLFHVTILFSLILLLTYPLNKRFSSLNRWIILFIYTVVTILVYIPKFSSLLYEGSYLFGDNIGEMLTYFYSDYSTEGLFSIGSIKNFIFFIIVLFYRNTIILNSSYGKLIFYFSCLFFILSRILGCIPTAFRINIYLAYFFIVALVLILKDSKRLFKQFIYILFSILLLKDVYNGWMYYPYSNSLPYIIGGHEPYSQRSAFNASEYFKRTGHSLDTSKW